MDVDTLLSLTLRTGSIYYFCHRHTTSSEPHYFVVLNDNPNTDKIILLLIASSQIEKVILRRKNMAPETVVIVKTGTHSDFKKDTVFDCNHVFEIHRDELRGKILRKEIDPSKCVDLPEHILDKVIKGVKESPLVENKYKKYLP